MAVEAAAVTLEESEDHVARVERVADDISAAADEIEQTRRLPKELLAKMHGEKLFRLLLPKVYGGLEIDPPTFFRVTSAIAQRDASVGWVTCQGNGCSTSAAYVPPETAMEVWGNDPAGVLAWGPGKADVEIREDGYHVKEGRWQFASGLRHATWLGGRFTYTRPDGTDDTRALLFSFRKTFHCRAISSRKSAIATVRFIQCPPRTFMRSVSPASPMASRVACWKISKPWRQRSNLIG